MDEVGRLTELERKVSTIVKAMKVLQRWIDIHEEITNDDTKLFDDLNERVTQLEIMVSPKRREK